MVNSTISGNTSGTSEVVVLTEISGLQVLTNVTITNNRLARGFGGGIMASGAVMLNNKLSSLVILLRASPSTTPDDITGPVNASSSNNLIGVNTNLSGISDGSNGNPIGTSAAPY